MYLSINIGVHSKFVLKNVEETVTIMNYQYYLYLIFEINLNGIVVTMVTNDMSSQISIEYPLKKNYSRQKQKIFR